MKFGYPLLLLVAPLGLLALAGRSRAALDYPWLALAPRHGVSIFADWLLRALTVLTVAALAFALARPYAPEARVERHGRGAQIVLLLDRSRSMDQPFGRRQDDGSGQSKAQVAQKLLLQFTAKRPDDLFGMVAFSGLPIPIAEFTQKAEFINASIAATTLDKGLSETNIGRAMVTALRYFEQRPYGGSRIVLLVSDGGDRIDVDLRQQITRLARQHRVGIYWIYIRSFNSPGLKDLPPEYADTVPEYFLHRFFGGIGTAYHNYEAEDPEALARAIDDVDRLEALPIRYEEVLARRDLSMWGYAIAFAALSIVTAARFGERRRLI